MIPHRTKRDPGPEMGETEKKLRFATAELNQALAFGAPYEKTERLRCKIAVLYAKLNAPKPLKILSRARSGPSEAEILKAIMKLLHAHPRVAKAWRQNSGLFQKQYGDKTHWIRANTAKGMSDIMGILKDGRTLAIEVKTPTGTVMAHQHEFLNSISQAGGLAFVARSVDDVVTKLEAA